MTQCRAPIWVAVDSRLESIAESTANAVLHNHTELIMAMIRRWATPSNVFESGETSVLAGLHLHTLYLHLASQSFCEGWIQQHKCKAVHDLQHLHELMGLDLLAGEMLVGSKKVILADEISTGLDSSTTYQIVKCMRNIVKLRRATMLMSLLQPAPETYDLFDDILLLAEGKTP